VKHKYTNSEENTMKHWPEYAPTEILPGLWQGGTEDDDVVGCPTPRGHYSRKSPFDVIVTLYADAMPAPWGVEELRFGFPDSCLTPLVELKAVSLARSAYQHWLAGERILIRCQAGVNRSGLVMALVLMHHGFSAADAISLQRSRRGNAVLSNENFETWLLSPSAEALIAQHATPSTFDRSTEA
jgi:hypothetical protein